MDKFELDRLHKRVEHYRDSHLSKLTAIERDVARIRATVENSPAPGYASEDYANLATQVAFAAKFASRYESAFELMQYIDAAEDASE